MTQLFFIVGRGRSGTTLLSRILTQHPELAVAPEGFFVMNLRRRYGDGAWDQARVSSFCGELLDENRMGTWQLDLVELEARLRAKLPALSYPEVCRTVYESHARDALGRAQVRWVGDKNPHYALLVRHLGEIFPDAKFVHITRDYRDNIRSYRSVPFDLDNGAALAYRWKRYNEVVLAESARRPDAFMHLRFEDLLSRPETELTRLTGFLGVGFEPQMLEFHKADDAGFYGRGSKWFDNLRKPLDAAQVSKWHDMPPDLVQEADAICGELGRRFGYVPEVAPGRLRLPSRAGALYGWSSVLAEELIFGVLPPETRTRFINAYRKLSGRI